MDSRWWRTNSGQRPLASGQKTPDAIEILRRGEIQLTGEFVWGSNSTYLVRVACDGQELPAVYKPSGGERPLWDFPEGSLAGREAAAYLTSEALGWGLVPPTVMRAEGPAGPGSLQLFVDADVERHYFTFTPEEKQRLRPVAVFDLLINNADRKAGHVLLAPNGHIWLIDHGVCFHEDDKLRTVIWDFIGEAIPEDIRGALRGFRDQLNDRKAPLRNALRANLSPRELKAMDRRAARLLEHPVFPGPGRGRPYPWPMV